MASKLIPLIFDKINKLVNFFGPYFPPPAYYAKKSENNSINNSKNNYSNRRITFGKY